MDIEPFALERWLADHEHGAAVNLGDSGVRPLEADRFDTDPGTLGYVVPTNGDPDLRERVADRYDRGADELLFTCGTQEANLLAVLATLDRESHAVCVTPTYQSLHSLPAAVADVTRVELDAPDWTLDPEAVADAVRPDTELIVVNNPNNPTGRIHPQGTVEALYDLAAAADAYLLCDEVYRPLAAPDERVDPVASMGPHGISTCGLSKGWGLPGLRFGWLAGPEEVVSDAWQWKDYTTISPSAFGQHVARQALDREADLLAENREHVRRNRDLLDEFAAEHGLDWYLPAGATGFLTVPEEFASGEAFCRALVDEGVVVVPGETFDRPGYVRVGFGAERATLREGLDRMATVIERGGR
ncbi:aminotransferase class I/II-fold pyridoxal phosphate-dependent enzyme [Halosimplex halophilum]|uniref:aminotransferase class I/II-fold pyridoxal phosphate-dependent enzyme n=1 Tax=Halosimplex halophilum TaxID=2559572 RepID=UPI00107F4A96|nr:aminotransferase class I/II-fold pyridoxal phosphate-dependent enzyme [Halosimplex halophilum]